MPSGDHAGSMTSLVRGTTRSRRSLSISARRSCVDRRMQSRRSPAGPHPNVTPLVRLVGHPSADRRRRDTRASRTPGVNDVAASLPVAEPALAKPPAKGATRVTECCRRSRRSAARACRARRSVDLAAPVLGGPVGLLLESAAATGPPAGARSVEAARPTPTPSRDWMYRLDPSATRPAGSVRPRASCVRARNRCRRRDGQRRDIEGREAGALSRQRDDEHQASAWPDSDRRRTVDTPRHQAASQALYYHRSRRIHAQLACSGSSPCSCSSARRSAGACRCDAVPRSRTRRRRAGVVEGGAIGPGC